MLPIVDLNTTTEDPKKGYYGAHTTILRNFSTLAEEAHCQAPGEVTGWEMAKLASAHIDNLARLELFHIPAGESMTLASEYEAIENHTLVQQVRATVESDGRFLAIDRKLMLLTSFGHAFIMSCVVDKER